MRTPETAHVEASYWPTPDVNLALGIARGGGFSDAFGMDEGGWLVGMTDRLAPRSRFAEDDFVAYSFLRTPDTGEGKLRILPSLYGERHELGWKKWSGSAVHGVNAELNQAGSGSHWKFEAGEVRRAPTVWLNADQCGREVATTHTPFWLRESGVTARSARAPRSHSVAAFKAAVTQP